MWLTPLAVVVLATAGTILLWDWNWLKSPLESRMSELAGRKVTLDGPLAVDLGRITHVTLNDVTIANAEGFEGDRLAHAEKIGISVEVLPLLRGRLVADRVAITKPHVELVRHKDGTSNWTVAEDEVPPAAKDGAERDDVPIVRLLTLEGGEITFTDQSRDLKLKGTIGAIGQSDEDAPRVDLQVAGTLGGRPLKIALGGGSIMMLKETREPYPFEIDAVLSETQVKMAGTAKEPIKMQGVDARVEVKGPNAADLFPLFGIPVPDTPPFAISGTLQRGSESYAVQKLQGKIGDSDIAGEMTIDPREKRLAIKGKLHSKVLDFDDVGPIFGLPPATGAGETASPEQRRQAEAYRKSDRLFPDAKLSLEKVRAVDAEVVYTADKVNAPGAPLAGVSVTLSLRDGVLTMAPLQMGIAGGRADARIRIDARQNVVATTSDIRFSGFDLKQFFTAARIQDAASGEVHGRVQLAGRGNSIRDMLGTSNGQIGIVVDKGTVSNLLMELAGLDIAESLGLLATGDKPVTLNCFVVDLAVEGGMAKPRAMVLDSSDTAIVGEGQINLKDEQMDVTVRPYPKDITLLSVRSPVHARGTLKSPSISPDARALAVRGGIAAALGALLSPVAALAAFIDLGEKVDVNCPALIKAAPKPPASKPVR